MKKKMKWILALGCTSILCAGAACAKETKVDEYEELGYTISVAYDANGGLYLARPGITVMDMFNPADYKADSDGVTRIKLMEPTSPARPSGGSDKITLTKQNYFFAGWYKNRTVKTVNGKPVDEDGRELKLLDEEEGTYGYLNPTDEEKELTVTPAYEYSGYWDFENDRVEYTGEKVTMTLYAGWVEFFEFNYYYKQNNQWTKLAETTSFDYKTTNAENSQYADKDTIWLPDWKDGAMNYEYKYADTSAYTFPKIEGTTFSKAYTDEACTQQIDASLEHHGNIKVSEGDTKALVVENRIQNVYIVADAGEQYRIETPEQLIKYANVNGLYEIYNDLDFSTTELKWPLAFSAGVFNGSMYGKDGQTVKLKNITADYASASARIGGLFGELSAKAKLKNVAFENATLNFTSVQVLPDAKFGLLAGNIDAQATLENIAIDGTIKIGAMMARAGREPSVCLVANGNKVGVTAGEIALQIYGEQLSEDVYYYTCDPTAAIKADAEGKLSLSFNTKQLDQVSYDINYETEVE